MARCGLAIALCGLKRSEEVPALLRLIINAPLARFDVSIIGIICAASAVYLSELQEREQAVTCLGFALNAEYEVFGWMKKWVLLQDLHQSLSAELDEAIFEAAWNEGQAMTLEQAVAYALE